MFMQINKMQNFSTILNILTQKIQTNSNYFFNSEKKPYM